MNPPARTMPGRRKGKVTATGCGTAAGGCDARLINRGVVAAGASAGVAKTGKDGFEPRAAHKIAHVGFAHEAAIGI